jgi:hypothetical protein
MKRTAPERFVVPFDRPTKVKRVFSVSFQVSEVDEAGTPRASQRSRQMEANGRMVDVGKMRGC